MKRTYQPHHIHARRRHGFSERMGTVSGRAVLARRRRKGRRKI